MALIDALPASRGRKPEHNVAVIRSAMSSSSLGLLGDGSVAVWQEGEQLAYRERGSAPDPYRDAVLIDPIP